VKGKGHKLQQRETPTGCKEKYFSPGHWKAQRGCKDSSAENTQTRAGHSPEKPDLVWSWP